MSVGVFAVLEPNTTYHVSLGLFTDQMEGELTSWTVHTPADVSHSNDDRRKRQLFSAFSSYTLISAYRTILAARFPRLGVPHYINRMINYYLSQNWHRRKNPQKKERVC